MEIVSYRMMAVNGEGKYMRIKSVTVATILGEKYMVGHTVNDVVIDDIIQNQDNSTIFCYENSELLVEITSNVPVVIEYMKEDAQCLK
jgi:hypothetical protein